MSSLTIWDQVLSRIEDQVGKHSFSTWFKPTSLLADGGHNLSIRVPNPLFVEWLPKHYSVVLAEALRDVGRPDVKLVFIPDGSDRVEDSEIHRAAPITRMTPISEETEPSGDAPVRAEPARAGSLIPRYTF